MEQEAIHALVEKQKEFFQSGQTFDLLWRTVQLSRLEAAIYKYEDRIMDALYMDLGKDRTEAWMSEVGMTLSELRWQRAHLFENACEKPVLTPLHQFYARSRIVNMPYGTVLVMSPWNYPFLLSMSPLIEAVAAGNTVILKPGHASENVSQVLADMMAETFDPAFITVILGGRQENTALLDEQFDYIFFTGSPAVGKTVMAKAACHLTPVTLELGGKSPTVVDETANIALTARRILWGKQLNAGQTCVAPDYVVVHKSVHDALVRQLRHEMNVQQNHTARIIDQKAWNRLKDLLEKEKELGRPIYTLEEPDYPRIPMTLVDAVNWDDPIMDQEIFGPILPILTYEDFADLMGTLSSLPRPLAFYLFSRDHGHIQYVKERMEFGGGCINDVVVHIANERLPFGGIGGSGMGQYHGKFGFETFTHPKGILEKGLWIDIPVRYRPYSRSMQRLVKKFIK